MTNTDTLPNPSNADIPMGEIHWMDADFNTIAIQPWPAEVSHDGEANDYAWGKLCGADCPYDEYDIVARHDTHVVS